MRVLALADKRPPVDPAEPAPEDQMLRRCDGRDRIELQEAEAADGVQDVGRRPVEELGANGDPPRLVLRNLDPYGGAH
mgnify:CR=1 FL=1